MTVIDCGAPIDSTGIVIESFNDTKLDAVITIHRKVSDIRLRAVCGSNGEWVPSLTSFECVNGTTGNIEEPGFFFFFYQRCLLTIPLPSESYCRSPTAPVNGHINSNYSSTVEGSRITFHCSGDSLMMTSTCTNGSWIPDAANLDCEPTSQGSITSNVGMHVFACTFATV